MSALDQSRRPPARWRCGPLQRARSTCRDRRWRRRARRRRARHTPDLQCRTRCRDDIFVFGVAMTTGAVASRARLQRRFARHHVEPDRRRDPDVGVELAALAKSCGGVAGGLLRERQSRGFAGVARSGSQSSVSSPSPSSPEVAVVGVVVEPGADDEGQRDHRHRCCHRHQPPHDGGEGTGPRHQRRVGQPPGTPGVAVPPPPVSSSAWRSASISLTTSSTSAPSAPMASSSAWTASSIVRAAASSSRACSRRRRPSASPMTRSRRSTLASCAWSAGVAGELLARPARPDGALPQGRGHDGHG